MAKGNCAKRAVLDRFCWLVEVKVGCVILGMEITFALNDGNGVARQ